MPTRIQARAWSIARFSSEHAFFNQHRETLQFHERSVARPMERRRPGDFPTIPGRTQELAGYEEQLARALGIPREFLVGSWEGDEQPVSRIAGRILDLWGKSVRSAIRRTKRQLAAQKKKDGTATENEYVKLPTPEERRFVDCMVELGIKSARLVPRDPWDDENKKEMS